MKLMTPLTLSLALMALCACQPQKQPTDLKVVSFNIRYDNPGDSANQWSNRRAGVNEFLAQTDADVMGLQEVLHGQLMDLQQGNPRYEAFGVGREDGREAGEYCPVFWKKDKYEVLDKGYFWLSEAPETPGFGWDAACERTAVWVILKDKATGGELLFLNTHLDHRGQEARAQSVDLLLTRANELADGRLTVMTGDFNARPTSGVIRSLTDASNPLAVVDSRSVAEQKEGEEHSFHDFGRTPISERGVIDYVFVRNGEYTVHNHRYVTETDEPGHVYLSDHNPVIVSLTFK